MHHGSATTFIRRHRELTLFVCALAVAAFAIRASLSSWLTGETWGRPVTTMQPNAGKGEPKPLFPDFSSIWEDGGRNPFGDAAIALESGGKARIPLPPPPPVLPDMPSAPMMLPVDLLTEGD